MRIAFLTPEYPSEYPDGGGLGTYVQRMAKLLVESGHDAEVFVISLGESGSSIHENVLVHRINASRNHRLVNFLRGATSRLVRISAWRSAGQWLLQAYALADALERRHAVIPFQLVQSADYLAAGLFVRRRRPRVNVVRCSTAADLYSQFDGTTSAAESFRGFLERWSMRRADIAYAPSQYLSEHFDRVHRIAVRVVHPPISRRPPEASELSIALPNRFFLHFGQLIERKGTDLLARALPIAWKMAPDLALVWTGRCWDSRKLDHWQSLWGDRRGQVLITGPLVRPELYAVLRRAAVAVLPSQVDNLPNTVIESLMLGVPVIGTRGASIDELVEEGKTGHLIAPGDVAGLADALVRMWRGDTPVKKGFDWSSPIVEQMRPPKAVANLIALTNIARQPSITAAGVHPPLPN